MDRHRRAGGFRDGPGEERDAEPIGREIPDPLQVRVLEPHVGSEPVDGRRLIEDRSKTAVGGEADERLVPDGGQRQRAARG
jgi:hypothetical protein